ncbi:MAG: substrate-binding domain-containing protein [Bacteroidales bacterium]|nr:substrate-binding domain-containing protein [Bacteroidales bacterium]
MYKSLKIILISYFFLISNFELGAQNEEYLIGFSQCTTSDIWREQMNREILNELTLYPNMEMIMRDANDNSQKQINDIKELVNKGIDLLIVSPNESKPLTPIVEEVYNKGIPVIVIDREIESDAYTAFIGADNYQIGREAGYYAANLLNGKGTIVEIWGLPGSSPAQERHAGFVDALQSYTNIEIIFSQTGRWNWQGGYDMMVRAKDTYDDFDLVFAHNDFMAKGAYNAANDYGIQNDLKFMGIDGLPGSEGGVQYVIDGKLDATLLYPTGGGRAIEIAWQILNGRQVSKENILQTVLIDSTNARVIKMQGDQIQSLQNKISAHKEILDKQVERFRSQRLLLILSLISVGLLIGLVVLMIRAYRHKQKTNRKLEEQNQEIEKRNQEIVKQHNKLKEMTGQLEEATQMKLRFFTNISHEFRTPLTLLLGPLEKVLHSPDFNEKQKHQFRMMHRNAMRLLRLINQLMDFRKLESAKMKLHAGYHNIVAFLSGVKESFDELAENKGIDFKLKAEHDHLMLWFDEDKLDKIMFNLLSNAFKYTPDGGMIHIRLRKVRHLFGADEKNAVEICVEDNGRGMSKEHVKQIFENFYQIEKRQSNFFPGTGIGLSLTKGLVELHHGDIHVESEKGQGTSFTLHFPIGNDHLNEDEIVTESIEEGGTKREIRSAPTETDVMPGLEENFNTGRLPFEENEIPTILLVEDNQDVRDYIRSSLTGDFHVIEAANGKEGIRKVEEEMPDLIVADVMMPEMDGMEMTRNLKNNLNTCHIPVILLTARASLEHKLDGLEVGADSYIPKPFNSRHLQVRVNKLIESRKRMREHYRANLDFDKESGDNFNQLDRKFINKAIKVINENMSREDFGVEEFSKEMSMSRVHLYRKIKQLTGMSVSEFIRSIKLKKAAGLLKNSGMSISEISYEVGFSTPSYFAKCFKEQFKVSPTEYLAGGR